MNTVDAARRRRLAVPLLAALALLFSAGPAAAIVNGEPVAEERMLRDFQWTVAVVTGATGSVCTGVLVSPRWVVTAAHCAGRRKHVLIGHPEREQARRVRVTRVIPHPRYTTEPVSYDIGLLRLARPVYFEPARVITRNEVWQYLRRDAEAEIAGWGITSRRSGFPDRLQAARVTLGGLTLQGSYLVYEDPRAGPCSGDSGGPLVLTLPDGQRVVAGIASVTDGNLCKAGGGIAAYISLGRVRDFLEQNVPDLFAREAPLPD